MGRNSVPLDTVLQCDRCGQSSAVFIYMDEMLCIHCAETAIDEDDDLWP